MNLTDQQWCLAKAGLLDTWQLSTALVFIQIALFLTYLVTGRRNTEIRTLKYGDFETNSSPSPVYGEGLGEGCVMVP
jgi:hypothetical protein